MALKQNHAAALLLRADCSGIRNQITLTPVLKDGADRLLLPDK